MSNWFKAFGWICLVVGVIASFVTLDTITNTNEAIEEYNLYAGYDEPEKELISSWFAWIPVIVMAFQSTFFFAIGEALKHLKRTSEETSIIRKALIQTNQNEAKDGI
ncbi:hypothetical protein GLV94_01990 [Virgibacillus halodenitrificans]|uniref:hypothetical protein n=1 Tax=Virgibacillus halodenitrificans TaxID=1482 RepID=UPI00136E2F87|nr:hypothetical protein [Virgibacillus halodenitrificans]MYL44405.1 hypothetical protein [Virgibacillus halodenitrificans]